MADDSVKIGIGRITKRDMVLVRVTTDDGVVGYGEAHHALAPTAVAELINTSIRELVVGAEALATEDVWNRVYRYQVKSHGMGAGVMTALSGVDMALWDIKGKVLGQPVCRLLGAEPKPVRAYAGGVTLGYQEPSALADEVHRYIDAFDFTAVKLRLGDTVADDILRVQHIRKVFGDGLDIMVDVNTSYDYVEILHLLPALEEAEVAWLEEPFPRQEVDALAELRRRSRIPIAAGENHFGRDDFRTLIHARAIDVVQADVSKTGGISELKKIADMAALYRLRMAPHTSHSNLNYAATLHVLSASPTAYVFEAAGFNNNRFGDALITAPIEIRGGHVRTPDAPGLGVEVDESLVDAFAAIPGAQNAR